MATSTEIKQRANTLADKTDVNSITPKEVGGIMYDLASHGENVLRNGGTLGIRKVYESVAAMEADSTNPKDFWGDPIKKGNLVVIYDGTTTGVDNNKIYAFMKPGWELATKLDAAYATKAETDAKLAELGSKVDKEISLPTLVQGGLDSNTGVIVTVDNRIRLSDFIYAPFSIAANEGFNLRLYTFDVDRKLVNNGEWVDSIELNDKDIYRYNVLFRKTDNSVITTSDNPIKCFNFKEGLIQEFEKIEKIISDSENEIKQNKESINRNADDLKAVTDKVDNLEFIGDVVPDSFKGNLYINEHGEFVYINNYNNRVFIYNIKNDGVFTFKGKTILTDRKSFVIGSVVSNNDVVEGGYCKELKFDGVISSGGNPTGCNVSFNVKKGDTIVVYYSVSNSSDIESKESVAGVVVLERVEQNSIKIEDVKEDVDSLVKDSLIEEKTLLKRLNSLNGLYFGNDGIVQDFSFNQGYSIRIYQPQKDTLLSFEISTTNTKRPMGAIAKISSLEDISVGASLNIIKAGTVAESEAVAESFIEEIQAKANDLFAVTSYVNTSISVNSIKKNKTKDVLQEIIETGAARKKITAIGSSGFDIDSGGQYALTEEQKRMYGVSSCITVGKVMQILLDYDETNLCAWSGRTASQTMFKSGLVPYILKDDVVLKSTKEDTIYSWNTDTIECPMTKDITKITPANIGSFNGVINGYNVYVYPTGGVIRLVDDSPSDVVIKKGSLLYKNPETLYHEGNAFIRGTIKNTFGLLLQIGANSEGATPEEIVNYCKLCISESGCQWYVILRRNTSIDVDCDLNRAADLLKQTFGSSYIDHMAYMISRKSLSDQGITPTTSDEYPDEKGLNSNPLTSTQINNSVPCDMECIATNRVPSSFWHSAYREDEEQTINEGHFNAQGLECLGKYLVRILKYQGKA